MPLHASSGVPCAFALRPSPDTSELTTEEHELVERHRKLLPRYQRQLLDLAQGVGRPRQREAALPAARVAEVIASQGLRTRPGQARESGASTPGADVGLSERGHPGMESTRTARVAPRTAGG